MEADDVEAVKMPLSRDEYSSWVGKVGASEDNSTMTRSDEEPLDDAAAFAIVTFNRGF